MGGGQHPRQKVTVVPGAGRRRRTRKEPILTLSPVSPCGCRPGGCVKFPPGGICQHASATADRDAESRGALKSPGGLTGSGHQAGRCGRITLTGGGSILVAPGEPKSIWRTLSPVQVNGNARPGNWPGVFITYCYQRLTAFPPPPLRSLFRAPPTAHRVQPWVVAPAKPEFSARTL